MKSVDCYSEKRVYAANLLTGILVLLMWVLTNKIFITIVTLALVSWATMIIFHKDATKRGRIVAILAILILFVIGALFYRVKTNENNENNDNQTVVQEDQKNNEDEDKNAEDKTDNNDAQGDGSKNSGAGSLYYGKSNAAKPKDTEVLAPNYSNVGGNSSGSSVNQGVAKTTADETTTIICPNNKSEEQDQKIKEKLDNGAEKIDLAGDIVAVIDKTPKKEEETPKDDSNKIEMDKEESVVVPSGETEEKIPDPLPDNEQLKQDAQNPTGDELDQMAEQTKPETPSKDEDSSNKEEENSNVEEDKNENSSNKEENSNVEEDKKENSSITENDSKKDEVKQDENNDSDLNKNDKPVEDSKPTEIVKTPVTITPLDGNNAIAGDSVQFKVTGEIKTIEGLEGLNYTQANGYITVNTTPGEATVITPVVIGADGVSTATTSVTVNVLN